jgi:hypothetical protein
LNCTNRLFKDELKKLKYLKKNKSPRFIIKLAMRKKTLILLFLDL